ncbi:hypothetical protein FISHEDRAFT_74786 [Fistulina hepatica ATCC 64428]|uniref:Uncharacterized protein n=1 Tax=Fistulina hepatica ATCC 64428 TaxID=1128425 RepID=A0A0D7AAB9_9AGAR|nr:hypothetical protein FISHEDRAFT_74786 [Fistulina hepatica ATCC 64428]
MSQTRSKTKNSASERLLDAAEPSAATPTHPQYRVVSSSAPHNEDEPEAPSPAIQALHEHGEAVSTQVQDESDSLMQPVQSKPMIIRIPPSRRLKSHMMDTNANLDVAVEGRAQTDGERGRVGRLTETPRIPSPPWPYHEASLERPISISSSPVEKTPQTPSRHLDIEISDALSPSLHRVQLGKARAPSSPDSEGFPDDPVFFHQRIEQVADAAVVSSVRRPVGPKQAHVVASTWRVWTSNGGWSMPERTVYDKTYRPRSPYHFSNSPSPPSSPTPKSSKRRRQDISRHADRAPVLAHGASKVGVTAAPQQVEASEDRDISQSPSPPPVKRPRGHPRKAEAEKSAASQSMSSKTMAPVEVTYSLFIEVEGRSRIEKGKRGGASKVVQDDSQCFGPATNLTTSSTFDDVLDAIAEECAANDLPIQSRGDLKVSSLKWAFRSKSGKKGPCLPFNTNKAYSTFIKQLYAVDDKEKLSQSTVVIVTMPFPVVPSRTTNISTPSVDVVADTSDTTAADESRLGSLILSHSSLETKLLPIVERLHNKYPIGRCSTHPTVRCVSMYSASHRRELHWELDSHRARVWARLIHQFKSSDDQIPLGTAGFSPDKDEIDPPTCRVSATHTPSHSLASSPFGAFPSTTPPNFDISTLLSSTMNPTMAAMAFGMPLYGLQHAAAMQMFGQHGGGMFAPVAAGSTSMPNPFQAFPTMLPAGGGGIQASSAPVPSSRPPDELSEARGSSPLLPDADLDIWFIQYGLKPPLTDKIKALGFELTDKVKNIPQAEFARVGMTFMELERFKAALKQYKRDSATDAHGHDTTT